MPSCLAKDDGGERNAGGFGFADSDGLSGRAILRKDFRVEVFDFVGYRSGEEQTRLGGNEFPYFVV